MKLGKILTKIGALLCTSLLGTELAIMPAAAQSYYGPYVVFVNGWQNCCSWGMNSLQNRLINQMNAEPRYVPYSNFDNNGRSGDTSTDEVFLRDGADFINNQLDKNRPLILIGHSFGGDSVLKLLPRINRRIQFVAVIDPVRTGGLRATLKALNVPSNVDYFFNRWQDNEPFPIDYHVNGSLPCDAVKCDQEKQPFYTNADGTVVRVACGTLEFCKHKNKRSGHQSLPTDDWIQRVIGDRIQEQLAALITPSVPNQPQPNKTIVMSRPFGSNVSFKTAAKGLYVVAENGGSGIINANRSAVGPWETFRLIDLNGGSLTSGDVVNLASDKGTYVVAENGGGGTLNVDRPNAGPWEEITILKANGSGKIHSGDIVLLRTKNGQFIVAEDGGGGRVNANRTAIGPWEQFIIEFR